ncbi:hypothetical protein FRC02_005776 [Tulasnella sp. 418]|nr:hypothetical protein FRC02_005776 [Tulasnella sp. 418]
MEIEVSSPRVRPTVSDASLPVHPITSLPTELLSYMFRMGAMEGPATFPTLVSHVSGYWRDVALKDSSLWTWIDFSDPFPYRRSRLWIQRSRCAPLHIVMSCKKGFNPEFVHLRHALEIALKEARRWECLSVHMDAEPLHYILRQCNICVPSLRYLSLKCTERDEMEDEYPLFGGQTPGLRRLFLDGVPVAWGGCFFQDLTELHLGYYEEELAPSLEQLTCILQRCTGLRRLVLDHTGITSSKDPDDFHPTPVRLPELKFVQCTHLDRDFYLWFARCFDAPVLESYIGNSSASDGEYEEAIANLKYRCPFPNLKRFRTQYARVFPPVALGMIDVMHRITDLEFFQCIVPNDVLEALIWQEGSCRARSLKRISLEHCQGFSVGSLITVVHSRLGATVFSAANDVARIDVLEVMQCSLTASTNDTDWLRQNVTNLVWIEQVRTMSTSPGIVLK